LFGKPGAYTKDSYRKKPSANCSETKLTGTVKRGNVFDAINGEEEEL
jgi:hypothetical protein